MVSSQETPDIGEGWEFWVDRGGTFTDLVARRPDGRILTHKLLSENDAYADAALQGIRDVLGVEAGATIPVERVHAVKLGTTVATNALLERKGDRVLLVVTKGFRDQLRIGHQARPHLFALEHQLPDMLYERVAEVSERIDVTGKVLEALDMTSIEPALQSAYDDGIRAVAIVCMHGYRFPSTRKTARRTGGGHWLYASVHQP